MKSVALHNLGCKVNAYELEVIGQKLQENGYDIVPFDKKADIYIVNTCTVTNIADRKSRQMLHRAKKMNPDAVVVAVGCYVQTGKEEALLDGSIDLAVGNNRKKDLVEILEAFLAKREKSGGRESGGDVWEEKTLSCRSVVDISREEAYEEMTLVRPSEEGQAGGEAGSEVGYGPVRGEAPGGRKPEEEALSAHTRAYIKIQDGCNQFCSYCIIPYARGRVRSRRQEDVLREIRGLVDSGVREVVLTGIHLSSYGMDFIDKTDGDYLENGKDLRGTAMERAYLLNLIREIAAVDGIERIRLGSLEPRIITEEFAGGLAALSKVCPHFHLSLQSGCDETLKRMNRHYTTEEYYDKVVLLRRVFDNPAITTDVIVGFPGETEEEFAVTKRFLEKVNFFEMHVFKYSKRQGTVAAAMDNQVPEQVKAERSARLLELERQQSTAYRQGYIGNEITILTEEAREIEGTEYRVGHTETYVKAAVPAQKAGGNQLVSGRAVRLLAEDILLLEI
ncbi:tRNA (N(6)-L-threonylcarbamoyladenosine(37)-C(2))-methylthiotransferase MtaB [Eisenbergiella sp.]